uniref:Transposase n=1 Tax=Ditylenchus dipsaci TaxID=166011 RepID=A0A915CMI2_9BILA
MVKRADHLIEMTQQQTYDCLSVRARAALLDRFRALIQQTGGSQHPCPRCKSTSLCQDVSWICPQCNHSVAFKNHANDGLKSLQWLGQLLDRQPSAAGTPS